MIRNHGGSFGIAFSTTMAARRSQFRQARLVEHLTPFDSSYVLSGTRISEALVSGTGQGVPTDAMGRSTGN